LFQRSDTIGMIGVMTTDGTEIEMTCGEFDDSIVSIE